jgi:hypothetical protein
VSSIIPHEGVSTAVCLGYHAQGAAIVAVQQAVAELVQQRTPDLHVREVVVAAGARGRGGASSSAGGGSKCGHSRERILDGVREDRLAGPSGKGLETKPCVILSLYTPNRYI